MVISALNNYPLFALYAHSDKGNNNNTTVEKEIKNLQRERKKGRERGIRGNNCEGNWRISWKLLALLLSNRKREETHRWPHAHYVQACSRVLLSFSSLWTLCCSGAAERVARCTMAPSLSMLFCGLRCL